MATAPERCKSGEENSSTKHQSWRRPSNESTYPQTKKRSHGISPRSFHPVLLEKETKNASNKVTTIASPSSQNQTKINENLSKILSTASNSVIKRRRETISTEYKNKRAAYREVTSLQLFPLQSLAMENLDELRGNSERRWHKKEKITKRDSKRKSRKKIKTDGESSSSCSSSDDDAENEKDGGVIKDDTEKESLNDDSSSEEEDEDEFDEITTEEEMVEKKAARTYLHTSPSPAKTPNKVLRRKMYKDEFLKEEYRLYHGQSNDDYNNQPLSSTTLPTLWSMEPRIFSIEKSSTGKRKYIVGQYGRFVDYYWRKTDVFLGRHYYELIKEDTPCRLYFDLEYSKEANPSLTPPLAEKLLEEFLSELYTYIQQIYNVTITRANVVDLDSSTYKKFSRHLIVHFPNDALFKDAIEVGRFVKFVIGRMAEDIATQKMAKEKRRNFLAKYLFVNSPSKKKKAAEKKEGEGGDNVEEVALNNENEAATEPQTCFVDLGVYTRNRLFRLLGSTKFGKPPSAALRISAANQFPFPAGFGNDKFYVPDMEKKIAASGVAVDDEIRGALVTPSPSSDQGSFLHRTNFDKERRLDNFGGHMETAGDDELMKFRKTMDWTMHAEALALTLVVPVNSSNGSSTILPNLSTIKGYTADSAEASPGMGKSTMSNQRSVIYGNNLSGRSAASFQGRHNSSYGPSPFPFLDEYVTNVLGARGGQTQGMIRCWSLSHAPASSSSSVDPSIQSITYHMSRNRWCEFIRREHKSNNIMWIVEMNGMYSWQSCYDPECRMIAQRGTPIPIPDDLKAKLEDSLFEQSLMALPDNNIVRHDANVIPAKEQSGIVDDDEFEKALLALDISSGVEKTASPAQPFGGITSCTSSNICYDQQQKERNEICLTSKPVSADCPYNDEWDDALNEALVSNPDLFP